MNFETAKEIEIAVAKWFGYRQNVIVPNVSWMLGYECDLFVLLPSGYGHEIEIKISKSDLRADTKKFHAHNSRYFRYLSFAIPEKLQTCIADIPERAGVFIVKRDGRVFRAREAKVNPAALKLDYEQRFKVARLGVIRVWGLKAKMLELKQKPTPLP